MYQSLYQEKKRFEEEKSLFIKAKETMHMLDENINHEKKYAKAINETEKARRTQ